MKPLENQLEINSHLWMYNRVREMLSREGWLTGHSSDEDIGQAFGRWAERMAKVSRRRDDRVARLIRQGGELPR